MAKRPDPSHAEFHAHRAAMLERAGDLGGALAAWAGACAASPMRGEYAHRAGVVAVKARRYREAVELLRRAAGLMPNSAMAHHDLGMALFRDGEYALAAGSFERSHALEPGAPIHLVHLALARERMRDAPGARAAAEAALALDPASGPAMIVVGECVLREGQAEEAIALAERALATPLAGRMEARAHHLIGLARERQGDHDGAFGAHMRCNEVVLERAGGRAALAVPIERSMRNLGREGLAERFARWSAEAPANTPDPVFLCGFPRSGTTLVEQVISVMPGMATNDEQANAGAVISEFEKRRPGALAGDLARALDKLPRDVVAAGRRVFWDEIVRRMPGYRAGVTAIDKQPMRIMDIGVVHRVFPRARMVVMVRDPRDVCLSALFQNFDPNPAMARFLTVETTGRFYAEVMEFWLEMRGIVAMPWIEVRYEDLVREFERETRRIAEFLGVPWTDAVFRFDRAARSRAVTTASYNAVSEGINDRSIGRWCAYRAHLGPVMERVGPLVSALGYSADHPAGQ
jgi:Flp pilus assembly protein TadD